MTVKQRLLQGLLSILIAVPGAGPALAQTAASDAAMLDLREAFRKGDSRALAQKLPQVQNHPLAPLAGYWDIRLRLDTATDSEIRAFMDRHAGTYYEDRLRNDWLLLLAKKGDWSGFSAELPRYRMNDDREVQCYDLMLRHRAGEADVAPRVRERWLGQREADNGCAAAAGALLADGKLEALAAWQRARLGMENNRQRVATQAVGLLNADWVATVNAVYDSPARFLDDKVTAIRTRTKELVTLALVRLAVSDPDAAVAQMNQMRWQVQLTQEERSWVWGVIGKRYAMRLSDEALPQFAKGQDHHMHEDHLVWKTRAALRAGDWTAVRQAIAAMGDRNRADATWTYWQARALLAQRTPAATDEAQTLLRRIAGTTGFYEQLALEELGQKITLPAAPPALTPEEKAAARDNPGLQRALRAIQIGLRAEGVREWNYTTNLHTPGGMAERELLAAADLACQREIWDRCINTSERTKEALDYVQRFPMPFRESVVRRAGEIGLDPAYVYGLIRQESRFIMDARSHVGASGLMQVMPATARWTARKIGLDNFQPQQITDRDTNIAIGTAYLKFALDDFEGSMPMAAAAYNAGPGRPRNWRNGPVLEAAIWAENIPFDETRDYVKKVLANTTNYAAILSSQPQSLKARLGSVGPRAAAARAVNTDLP